MRRSGIVRAVAVASGLAVIALSIVVRTTAFAVSGDGGTGTYRPASAANTYIATVKNTGSTDQKFDYIQVPSSNSVTACSTVEGLGVVVRVVAVSPFTTCVTAADVLAR